MPDKKKETIQIPERLLPPKPFTFEMHIDADRCLCFETVRRNIYMDRDMAWMVIEKIDLIREYAETGIAKQLPPPMQSGLRL